MISRSRANPQRASSRCSRLKMEADHWTTFATVRGPSEGNWLYEYCKQRCPSNRYVRQHRRTTCRNHCVAACRRQKPKWFSNLDYLRNRSGHTTTNHGTSLIPQRSTHTSTDFDQDRHHSTSPAASRLFATNLISRSRPYTSIQSSSALPSITVVSGTTKLLKR